MALSFFKKLERFPPVLCRLVAVHRPGGGRSWPVPLSDEQIVLGCDSQLSMAEVRFIGQLTTWDGLSIKDVRLFLKGCRLTLDNWGQFGRITKTTTRAKFHYLHRDPRFESQFKELLAIWEAHARRR